MYLDYHYKAGSSYATVRQDLINVLLGETNIANLSSDCDKTKTTITSTVASGWSTHDAVADSYNYILKSTVSDDVNKEKYVGLYGASTVFNLKVYNDWNAATNTTTYLLATSTASTQPFSGTYSGRFLLASSANFILFLGEYYDPTTSTNQPKIGTSSNDYGPTMASERSREMPWDTVTNGYIPFLHINPGSWAVSATTSGKGESLRHPLPFYGWKPSPTLADVYGIYGARLIGWGPNEASPTRIATSTPGEYDMVVAPLLVRSGSLTDYTNYLGNISEKSGVYICPAYSLPRYHEFTMLTKTYVAWPVGRVDSGYGGCVLVPKE